MKNQIKTKTLGLLTIALSLNLISCAGEKKEDPALEGIWHAKIEKINPLTNEETVEIVTYEFRGERITTHYMKQTDADLSSQDQMQTEYGTYKKVEDSLEITLEQSTCAVYSESENQTAFSGNKSRKVFYKLDADQKTLIIKDLTKDLELTKLDEGEEDGYAHNVQEAVQGCFVRQSSSREVVFAVNPLTTIDRRDPRSGDPLN